MLKGICFCCGSLALLLLPPAVTKVQSDRPNDGADVQIQLKALVTIKSGEDAKTYLCDIPDANGLRVMLRKLAVDKDVLIHQLQFERSGGFTQSDEKKYPALVLTPDIKAEKPVWNYHFENDSICTLPEDEPQSPMDDPAAVTKLLAHIDEPATANPTLAPSNEP